MLIRIVASFCLLVACGGVGGDDTPLADAGDSIDASTNDAAPTFDAPPSSGVVNVTIRLAGVPVPDLAIVFHDSTGEVVTSTTTDSEGKASATVSRDAMVTVIVDSTSNLTIVGVQPLDNIELGGDLSPSNNLVTQADITVPSTTAASGYFFTNGCSSFSTATPTAPFALAVNEGCLAADGTFTIIGRAVDAGNNVVAWTSATEVVPAGAVTNVTVGDWDTNVQTLDFAFNNAPSGASLFTASATLAVAGVTLANGGDSAALVPTGGASVSLPIFAEAESVVYAAMVSYDDRGQSAVGTISVRADTVPAVVSLMGSDYSPTIDTLTIDTLDPVRIGMAWTIGGTVSENSAMIVNFRWVAGVGGSRSWMLICPPSSTAVTVPVLPGPLASAGPDATSTFNQSVVVSLTSSDQIPSYADFRQNSAGFQFGDDVFPATGPYSFYNFVIQDTP